MAMEKEDVIRLAVYTAALALFLIVYNVVLAANAFLTTTDFRLYGNLCAVFTWLMLMMIDLTFTIGSFSNAWITVVAIALGLCIYGFGIHMLVELSDWLSHGSGGPYDPIIFNARQSVYENPWLYGLTITPMFGGVAANLLIIWRLRYEELGWWMGLAYITAFFVCVAICWLLADIVSYVMMIVYIVCSIGYLIVGFFTVKDVFF